MKKMKKWSAFLRLLGFALLFVGVAGILTVSCKKENAVIDPVAEPCLDAVNDLAAFLDPLQHVLWADPEQLETVLAVLNAVPAPDNTYFMQGITPGGAPVTIRFTVQYLNAPDIYYQANMTDAVANPDLVKSFEESGTSYRVYKNAECGKGGPGFTSFCENLADGSSRHRVWNSYPLPTCKRGAGFCVEALTVAGVEVTFLNQNCAGLIKSTRDMLAYQCQ